MAACIESAPGEQVLLDQVHAPDLRSNVMWHMSVDQKLRRMTSHAAVAPDTAAGSDKAWRAVQGRTVPQLGWNLPIGIYR